MLSTLPGGGPLPICAIALLSASGVSVAMSLPMSIPLMACMYSSTASSIVAMFTLLLGLDELDDLPGTVYLLHGLAHGEVIAGGVCVRDDEDVAVAFLALGFNTVRFERLLRPCHQRAGLTHRLRREVLQHIGHLAGNGIVGV